MTMHPPANKRCQIYLDVNGYQRCVNQGDHWEKWGGCNCGENTQFCEGDIFTWECSGGHVAQATAVA